MKKIFAILSLVCFAFAVNAQTSNPDNNSSDTTHRHFANRNWHRNGNDSSHRKNFNRDDRGEAMNNRFRDRGDYRGRGGDDKFHSFGRRGDWGGERSHIRYSPEQRKQVMAINMDFKKKSTDLYKNDNLKLGEYKAQLLALQKDKKSKLQNLLTPEQKTKIAEQKKKRDENMQVMAAARLERMKIKLNLTDQQEATIKSKEQNLRTQMRAIRENDNLMAYQKMEQMKSLAEKHKAEIKSVLTPEQQTQFDNMHKQKFGGR
jgi:Spy/CpxP family protein refolding chaperone